MISTEAQQGIFGRNVYLYWTCATKIWSQRGCFLVWAEFRLYFKQYILKNSEMTDVSNNHINVIPVSILFKHKNACIYVIFIYIYLYVWTTFWISVILVLFQWKLCNIYEESGFSSIKLPKYLLRFTHSPDLLVHEIKYIEHQTFIQIKSLFYLVQSVPLWSFFIFHKKWCSVINATVSKTKGEKKDKKEEGNQSKNKTTYSSKLKPAWYSYAG